MSELPENLQIKREPSPSSSEDITPKNIKAKLNLHVKRRLQDLNQSQPENNTNFSAKCEIAIADIKKESQKNETIRQKRPYHKRTDKNKSTLPSENTSLALPTTEPNTASNRKNKIKQSQANPKQDILPGNSTEENTALNYNPSIAAGAVSAGDEDENDLKAAKEKEKCPDVLGMVLSMKKRSLMQDPEVQNFLKEIMDVIKS